MSTIMRERHIAAVLVSLVLSLFTLFGLPSATMATADNPVGDITNTLDTISVYKHANPDGTLEHGNDDEVSARGEALDGVPFTLYRVEDVGLVNGNAGWGVVGKVADSAKPVEPTPDNQNSPTKVTIDGKKYALKEIDEKTTADRTGLAQFADVYPGLYIVVELKASLPPGSVIVAKVAPFFATLPIKDAKGTWSYVANVYPKNTVPPKPEKFAEVKNATDDVITWTVKQTLLTSDDTNKLTKFRFEDDLSGAGDTKGTLTSVEVVVSERDRTGDFNKEFANLDGKHLVITAKNSGDLPSDGEIVATYTTGALGNGQLRDSVLSFISDVEIDHVLAFADLSRITAEKLDATDKTLYLNGAEFKVCISEDGARGIGDCLAVGMIITEKSLGTGSLDKLKTQKYVLFKTVAPAGYTFSPNTSYKVNLITATYNTVTLTIENTEVNMSALPLTGADGQLLMTIGGVAFVLLIGGALLVTCRKRFKRWTPKCSASLMRGYELLSGLHSTTPCGGESQEGFPTTAIPTPQQPQPPEKHDQNQPQRTPS